MGIQLQDSSGNIIISPDSIGSSDQQVADKSLNLINPATEGTLDSILQVATEEIIGVVEHKNGIATSTPATVSFSGTSQSILINNTDLATNILVSFDGDVNTFTIKKGQSLSIDAAHSSVRVSTSAGTATFQMVVIV